MLDREHSVEGAYSKKRWRKLFSRPGLLGPLHAGDSGGLKKFRSDLVSRSPCSCRAIPRSIPSLRSVPTPGRSMCSLVFEELARQEAEAAEIIQEFRSLLPGRRLPSSSSRKAEFRLCESGCRENRWHARSWAQEVSRSYDNWKKNAHDPQAKLELWPVESAISPIVSKCGWKHSNWHELPE